MISIRRRPRVDWFRIIAELRRFGFSQKTIALNLGTSRSTVRNWAEGDSPRYEDGRALLMLWRKAAIANRRMAQKGL